ncbi:HNH endonuclease family protein [Streptomyces coeruleorubidus]|uniref:HNH endonuclease family protein n=1 Tax=Streptomyces coeruleorubidus TaxID=116188 RepID=A0ABZ0KRQ0_STRC4|nr:HNH endonuclease family protein [Streptomyces coeruleorubidus]WOT40734.1 HNH endonuclease family protein [Streptomyces coeruleorubidus]
MRLLATFAAATAALAALTLPAHAAPGPLGEAGGTLALPLRDAVKALPAADETRAGYTRTSFRHWTDADKDQCNTRKEVLLAEAFIAPEQGSRCALTGGEWYSPYDDVYVEAAGGLDVDHMVPLAEAWDSGAGEWSAKEREAYANDLGDDRALVAVTARSNRSKADQDPATWLPPAEAYRCEYLADWVAVKVRWQLAVDDVERQALTDGMANCPNEPVKVTLAR